jgi:hypothetical protein
MRFLTMISTLVTGLTVATIAATGNAAPQMLAAAATTEPVKFHCQGDICRAEIQTICLEESRQVPKVGTRYHLAAGSHLRLSGTGSGGQSIPLTGKMSVALASLRGWTVVEVSVPRSELTKLGVDNLTVEVEQNVSLIPAAVAGDPRPHNPAGIKHVASTMRAIASDVMTERRGEVDAAQYLSKLGLGLSATEARAANGADSYWRQISALLKKAPDASQPFLNKAYDDCRASTRGIENHLSGCFKKNADSIMSDVTRDYWQQARPKF